MRQVRYWGLEKVAVQVLMTRLVVNCQRLASLPKADRGPPMGGLVPGGGRKEAIRQRVANK